MSRNAAVVRVRMGSQRLPGKVLLEVQGKPLLGHLLDRVERCQDIDTIVIATSVQPENDPVEQYCNQRGVACFRGSEDDVLARMIGALESVDADIGTEIYGDSCLCDPEIMSLVIQTFNSNPSYDLVGNDLILTYPSGMLVETFTRQALQDAHERTSDPELLEHGTRFIRLNPTIYKLKNIEAPPEFRRPDLHLDVDTPEDAKLVEAILEHFAPNNDMSLADIIAFLDAHPHIKALNQAVPRRWQQSLDESAKRYSESSQS